MRAEKHLEPCTETCKYNTNGRCCFGIRRIGCYLDDETRLAAGQLLGRAKEINSIQALKDILKTGEEK